MWKEYFGTGFYASLIYWFVVAATLDKQLPKINYLNLPWIDNLFASVKWKKYALFSFDYSVISDCSMFGIKFL